MDRFRNKSNKSLNSNNNDDKSSASFTTVCSSLNDENNNKNNNDDYLDDVCVNDGEINSTELHYLVFHNKINDVQRYIDSHKKNLDKLSLQDKHGNTPLHIACMLGHIDIVKRLINANCRVKVRNKQMWTPLNEAISYGNREMIKMVLEKFEKEVDVMIEDAKPKITSALAEMIDFYVEIKWDFETWIPLVSRFLPSDICKLHKKGTKIRIDCTLGDITAAKSTTSNNNNNNNSSSTNTSNNASNQNLNTAKSPSASTAFNWHRGDLTFLIDIEQIGKKNSIVFMDNKRKIFMNIEKDINEEHDLEREMDLYMSKEMIFLKLNTKIANFVPTQVGWFSKRDKIEQVNGYTCQFYDVNNLFIVSKLRNEHLTDEEIKKMEEKQKKLKKSFNNTTTSNQNNNNHENTNYEQLNDESNSNDLNDLLNIEYKPSLPPPPDSHVNWNDYINAPAGNWPTLGRVPRLKESKKEFKAQLAVSQEFPLSLADLNRLLDALAPLAKFRKLKEFLHAKLPPGFPVKIDIPVVPTVTAKVSFQNFKKNIQINDNIFQIPNDYVEDVEDKYENDDEEAYEDASQVD